MKAHTDDADFGADEHGEKIGFLQIRVHPRWNPRHPRAIFILRLETHTQAIVIPPPMKAVK
jgi:hypothetical protein